MATPPLTASRPVVAPPRWAATRAALSAPWPAVCATLLSVAGVFSIFSTGLYLWALWRTDPLKSIGAFVPAVSLALILRAWRALGWETRGSWWGLLLLAAVIGLVHLRDGVVLELVLTPSWSLFLPPHSLVAFGYVSGAVLLFGGTRLYRAAWFPILLILLVNPVPHVFNRMVDLPLQHASAATAREFARALGQRLTPDQLSLMFTPDFGMFIAPGCDGIRGSVTMGLIALVAGFLYRFRLRVWALAVAAAVLLGYVFNLVRLCVLVLYYVVALHVPWLQSRAEMGDYLIGATLFFFATLLLFGMVFRFSPGGDLRPPPLPFGPFPTAEPGTPSPIASKCNSFWARCFAFAFLAVSGSAGYARELAHPAVRPPDQAVFPTELGSYRLRRTWQEKLTNGQTIFDWAEYGLPGAGSVVSVGISPVLGAHDTLLCHTARGEDWSWHGALTLPTLAGPVSFSGSFYDAGATEFLEASTVCTGASCGQYASERRHFGLVYSRVDSASLLSKNPRRPIPVLLRIETPDASGDPARTRQALEAQLRHFVGDVTFGALTAPYRPR